MFLEAKQNKIQLRLRDEGVQFDTEVTEQGPGATGNLSVKFLIVPGCSALSVLK